MKRITPADEYQLIFLRKCVDNLDQERFRDPDNQNVIGKAAVARSELQEFVVKLRKEGVNI